MKPKILYVDDERHNLAGFKASFRDDFDILLSESGREALNVLEEHKYNSIAVIVSDQRMPHMNGDEFFMCVPKGHQHATRILLTAYTDLQAAKQALNRGRISFFFNKPFEENEFRSALLKGCKLFDKKVQLEIEAEEIKKLSQQQIQNIVTHHEVDRELLSEVLHEEFAQKLASLKLYLYALEASQDIDISAKTIRQIDRVLNESISNVRDICFKVMPRSMKDYGLKETLDNLIQKCCEATDIECSIKKYEIPMLSIESQLFVYRIIEELVSSIVNLPTQPEQLQLSLQNNLQIIFEGLEHKNEWEVERNLQWKIEAFNGIVSQQSTSLEITFDPLA